MEELVQYIREELPNDGEWWDLANEKIYLHYAGLLFDNDMEVEEIKTMLSDLYTAVANEFQ